MSEEAARFGLRVSQGFLRDVQSLVLTHPWDCDVGCHFESQICAGKFHRVLLFHVIVKGKTFCSKLFIRLEYGLQNSQTSSSYGKPSR